MNKPTTDYKALAAALRRVNETNGANDELSRVIQSLRQGERLIVVEPTAFTPLTEPIAELLPSHTMVSRSVVAEVIARSDVQLAGSTNDLSKVYIAAGVSRQQAPESVSSVQEMSQSQASEKYGYNPKTGMYSADAVDAARRRMANS